MLSVFYYIKFQWKYWVYLYINNQFSLQFVLITKVKMSPKYVKFSCFLKLDCRNSNLWSQTCTSNTPLRSFNYINFRSNSFLKLNYLYLNLWSQTRTSNTPLRSFRYINFSLHNFLKLDYLNPNLWSQTRTSNTPLRDGLHLFSTSLWKLSTWLKQTVFYSYLSHLYCITIDIYLTNFKFLFKIVNYASLFFLSKVPRPRSKWELSLSCKKTHLVML